MIARLTSVTTPDGRTEGSNTNHLTPKFCSGVYTGSKVQGLTRISAIPGHNKAFQDGLNRPGHGQTSVLFRLRLIMKYSSLSKWRFSDASLSLSICMRHCLVSPRPCIGSNTREGRYRRATGTGANASSRNLGKGYLLTGIQGPMPRGANKGQ